jgi:hypothetical protein
MGQPGRGLRWGPREQMVMEPSHSGRTWAFRRQCGGSATCRARPFPETLPSDHWPPLLILPGLNQASSSPALLCCRILLPTFHRPDGDAIHNVIPVEQRWRAFRLVSRRGRLFGTTSHSGGGGPLEVVRPKPGLDPSETDPQRGILCLSRQPSISPAPVMTQPRNSHWRPTSLQPASIGSRSLSALFDDDVRTL